MIYLLAFCLCLLADVNKKRKWLYGISLLLVYVILCFGYMCGSDWVNYEVVYTDNNALNVYSNSEFGFVLLVKLFNSVISDFWIFNAICKIFFLSSLSRFFLNFTRFNWTCVGLSFAFKTLFLLIDCPMRFMIGLGVLFYSIPPLLKSKKNWIKYWVIVAIATTLHNACLIIGIFIIIPFLFIKICRWKTIWLAVLPLVEIFLTGSMKFYQLIIDCLASVLSLVLPGDNRLLFYAFFRVSDSLFTIELIWHYVFLLFIIGARHHIMANRYGDIVFSASWFYIVILQLISPLPTSFRLPIILGYFFVVAIVWIVKYYYKIFAYRIKYIPLVIVLWCMVVIGKDVYSIPAYYPYSNSIPYIMVGHLPYSYRIQYNQKEYQKTFGNKQKTNSAEKQNLNQ